MSSLIEGYNYDIFISYRQKDNKYDGWVTEFVENIKRELEATFKEEISVYFDINPHDGLLESHDVDASLKEKLKCLIFIPIISKTYCDPNSFAWENELKAFAEHASNDHFGLMVKLQNGNFTNRILPVRIHEITECDVKLFETITGSFLRGIEFIYKEPGVNRPLRSNEENPTANLNHTFYRNQVNKVSNAIQEMILAIQHPEQRSDDNSPKKLLSESVSSKKSILKIITGAIIAITLIFAGILFIPKIYNTDDKVANSIAVLPFYSMSSDSSNQFLADGMMDAILTHLSKINDLRVISRTSVEQYRKTKKTTNEIGGELNVNYILEGSFQKSGDSIRLIAQLIKVGKEGHVWSDIYDRLWNNVFSVQSEVASKIASELKGVLTPSEIKMMNEKPTENLEAYQAYLRGLYYEGQPHFLIDEGIQAVQGFQDAVDIDTTFSLAWGKLARAQARLYYLSYDLTQSGLMKAKKAAANALRLGSDQPKVHIELGYYYQWALKDKVQALKQFEIAEKSLPNDFDVLLGKSEIIRTSGRWDEYFKMLEKLNQRRPNNASTLTSMAEVCWWTRRHKDAIDFFNQAIAISPNNATPYIYKAFDYMSWKGSGEESLESIKHIGNKNEWYLIAWYFQETGVGNLENALKFASDTSLGWGVNNKMWIIPRSLLAAFIYDYQDKPQLARSNYMTAIEILENKVSQFPNDRRFHGALGIAFAGIGKKEEAIKEGQRAVDLLPITKDALYGLGELNDLAIIYTIVGEYDRALGTLETLLSVPSWITPEWIKNDIRFAPLKSYPAFEKLMAKYPVDN
jgi:TolB-like protein/tetratricopeptide (TPR) repeat protein